MLKEPVVIKNFFPPGILQKLQKLCLQIRNTPGVQVDEKTFKRFEIHKEPIVDLLHTEVVAKETFKIFGEKLKPSYSYLSMYFVGEGVCPLHVDREQCYMTVDVCINQKGPWPLYVNHEVPYHNENDPELIEKVKKTSKAYVLEPGDALCYSGTLHGHWRDVIQPGNFCDLAFFHFVKEDFEGSLD